jgi:hypothetical protein
LLCLIYVVSVHIPGGYEREQGKSEVDEMQSAAVKDVRNIQIGFPNRMKIFEVAWSTLEIRESE